MYCCFKPLPFRNWVGAFFSLSKSHTMKKFMFLFSLVLSFIVIEDDLMGQSYHITWYDYEVLQADSLEQMWVRDHWQLIPQAVEKGFLEIYTETSVYTNEISEKEIQWLEELVGNTIAEAYEDKNKSFPYYLEWVFLVHQRPTITVFPYDDGKHPIDSTDHYTIQWQEDRGYARVRNSFIGQQA
jgi:hypothetical protein